MNDDGIPRHDGLLRGIMRLTVVRLILLTASLFAIYVALQLLRAISVQATPMPLRSSLLIFENVIIYTLLIFAYRGMVRLVEAREAVELSLRGDWVSSGILFGSLLFGAVYAVLWTKGVVTFAGVKDLDGVVPIMADALTTAAGEEIITRGAVFRILEEGTGTLVALIVSATLFGLMHAGNTGATLVSTISVAIEGGVMIGIAYTATRSLWFPIGIHFGWNFTEGGIFSAPISGAPAPGWLNFVVAGPESWTGGAFGPEASIAAVAVCLAATVALGWVAIRDGRWRPFAIRSRLA